MLVSQRKEVRTRFSAELNICMVVSMSWLLSCNTFKYLGVLIQIAYSWSPACQSCLHHIARKLLELWFSRQNLHGLVNTMSCHDQKLRICKTLIALPYLEYNVAPLYWAPHLTETAHCNNYWRVQVQRFGLTALAVYKSWDDSYYNQGLQLAGLSNPRK